jgi:peptidoglycan hydrolase CwlO-like protein
MVRSSSSSRAARRRSPLVALLLAAATLVAATTGPASADLQSQIGASQAKDRTLQQGIDADRQHIQGFAGRISDLRERLNGLQSSLAGEQQQLVTLQSDLRAARARLTKLRLQYVRDRRILAAQLVGQYEAPKPTLVNVVLQAHGFADLLELADRFKAVADHNAQVANRVKLARTQVTRQTARLTDLEAQQERVTQALSAQRDAVAQLKLAVVEKQLTYVRARSAKSAQLTALRSKRGRLQKQLAKIQAAQNASIRGSGVTATGPGLPPGGAPPWSPHSGAYGFFQAPGTNYSVGDTPRIAARLDVMGKALHLHLIGLSGYRTPQHSVEVGGFANDPHTRGQASDTPGLEGVPEATLNRYGLTRPFGGVAELDHVQLVGSI